MYFLKIFRRRQVGQEVELLSVSRDKGRTFPDCCIKFRAPAGQVHQVGGDIDLLQDFRQFQKYAFLLHGLWVRHKCEAASTDREAARLWGDSVAAAASKDGSA